MSLIGGLGKKHISLMKLWLPTGMTFAATTGLGILYVTDWKLVLQYVPFYNTKFNGDE